MEAILRALASAEEIINSDRDQAIALAASVLGESRRPELEADWGKHDFTLQLGQSLLLTLEDQARWAIKSGLVDKEDVPDYRRLIEPGPMVTVKPQAVSFIH